jgi:carboxylesterase type B
LAKLLQYFIIVRLSDISSAGIVTLYFTGKRKSNSDAWPAPLNQGKTIAEAICRKYSSKGSLPEQGVKAVDFYGDLFFYSPAVQSLNMHAFNNHKTTQFQYMSRRRSALSPSLEYFPWFKGAGHASELLFLFPVKYNVTIPADDISLSLTMMKYWSNFAKTGYVLYCID